MPEVPSLAKFFPQTRHNFQIKMCLISCPDYLTVTLFTDSVVQIMAGIVSSSTLIRNEAYIKSMNGVLSGWSLHVISDWISEFQP